MANNNIVITIDNIVNQEVDTIVNAANNSLLGGGGLMVPFIELPDRDYLKNVEI